MVPVLQQSEYDFSVDWFSWATPVWSDLLSRFLPKKVLEIGSFEGRSACYLIDVLGQQHPLELHCVDTFQGGIEHIGQEMDIVEARFEANLRHAISRSAHAIDLHVHKLPSDLALSRLFAAGQGGTYDFIYIDGSHQAPDVLADAVLSFRLLRIGGLLAFDDYLWFEDLPEGPDLLRMPKPAIDAFVNIYARKLRILNAPLGQLYAVKIAE